MIKRIREVLSLAVGAGACAVGTALLLIGIGLPASVAAQGFAAASAEPQFVPGEVIIQYRATASEDAQAAARRRTGAERDEVLLAQSRRRDGRGDLELARLPPGQTVAAAVRQLQGDPAVEFAEPNWVYHHQATSDDPYYTAGSLWGMYGDQTTPQNAFGSQAAEAWAAGHTGSSEVVVAVIDEGIMTSHEDLAPNIWGNPFEIPNNGIDDDGNGYVDDVNGWDFANNDNSVYDGGSGDKHGTHVAGTIGAAGGNHAGVAGVNWNVRIISAKFLGRSGGTTANAIRAIDYVTDLKTRHTMNIVATNNSWGGGGFSQALLDAINRGGDAGILFIAAAGNGGRDGVGDDNDKTAFYPANYTCTNGGTRGWDCLIAVAAITSSGAKASFSNYGLTSVELGAPGVGIYSTLPGKGGTSSYGSYSGTSMATPHVTGAVALYAASHAGASAAEIKAAVLGATTATPSLSGKTITGGRLNAGGF